MITKLISYILITGIVGIITKQITTGRRTFKKNNKKGYYKDHIREAITFLVCGILWILILIVLSILPSNLEGSAKWNVMCIFIGIALLMFLLAVAYYLWYLGVENEKIVYRNFFGKVTEVSCKDITCGIVDGYGKLKLYIDGKVVLTIADIYDAQFVLSRLKTHDVEIKWESSQDEFIMRVDKVQKGLLIFSLVAGGGLVVLVIYTKSVLGLLLFGGTLIVAIIESIKNFTKKICVSNDRILVTGVLVGRKEIPFSSIKYVKRKNEGVCEKIFLYSDQKLVFEYNNLYKNANLFERVIKRYKWKEKC